MGMCISQGHDNAVGLQNYKHGLYFSSIIGYFKVFLAGNNNPMENFYDTLKRKGYKKINFKVSKTQHLLIKGKINGIEGNFILDTGASNSCVDYEGIERFALSATHSETTASGAGGTGMATQTSLKNSLKLGRWNTKNFGLVIFDMSHVNEALRQYKAKPVHGIIGADILLKGKAIIDYYNHCFYLK